MQVKSNRVKKLLERQCQSFKTVLQMELNVKICKMLSVSQKSSKEKLKATKNSLARRIFPTLGTFLFIFRVLQTHKNMSHAHLARVNGFHPIKGIILKLGN